MTMVPFVDFNAQMLQLARSRAHLTQSELAALVDVPQGVVSRFENAVLVPTPEQVERLADALRVQPSFFQRPRTEEFWAAPVMYRLQRKAKAADLQQLVATMQTHAMHLREMQRSVDIEPTLPLPEVSEGTAPEEAAAIVREAWLLRPGPVPNVTMRLEAAGVFVVELASAVAQFDGAVYRAPGLPACIFVKADQPGDRRRFTLAHELGHLVMHSRPDLESHDDANTFASEWLMPAVEARRAIGPRPDLFRLLDVKRKWGVSVQFLVMRAAALGLITPRQKTSMFQRINALGWRTREPHPSPLEPVSLAPRVLSSMRDELDYTDDELATALHELPETVRVMYGSATADALHRNGLKIL